MTNCYLNPIMNDGNFYTSSRKKITKTAHLPILRKRGNKSVEEIVY